MKYIKIYENLRTNIFYVVKNDNNLHISLFKIYLLLYPEITKKNDFESLAKIFNFITLRINLFKNETNKFRKNFYFSLDFYNKNITYSKYDYSPETCDFVKKGYKYMGHLELNDNDIEKYEKYKDEYDMYINVKNFNL